MNLRVPHFLDIEHGIVVEQLGLNPLSLIIPSLYFCKKIQDFSQRKNQVVSGILIWILDHRQLLVAAAQLFLLVQLPADDTIGSRDRNIEAASPN